MEPLPFTVAREEEAVDLPFGDGNSAVAANARAGAASAEALSFAVDELTFGLASSRCIVDSIAGSAEALDEAARKLEGDVAKARQPSAWELLEREEAARDEADAAAAARRKAEHAAAVQAIDPEPEPEPEPEPAVPPPQKVRHDPFRKSAASAAAAKEPGFFRSAGVTRGAAPRGVGGRGAGAGRGGAGRGNAGCGSAERGGALARSRERRAEAAAAVAPEPVARAGRRVPVAGRREGAAAAAAPAGSRERRVYRALYG